MRDVPYIVHVTEALAAYEAFALATRKCPPVTELVRRKRIFVAVMVWLLLLGWHLVYNAFVAQLVEASVSRTDEGQRA